MKISRDDLMELCFSGTTDEYEVIENKLTGSSRWDNHYRLVFKYQDKFYEFEWYQGATESQDYHYFDINSAKEFKVVEVVPVERTIIEYVRKDEDL